MGMTTEENEQRKARFWQLVQRHNQLGRLLPALEEIQAGERHDDAGLILDEMHKVQRQIDALIGTKIAPPVKGIIT